MLFSQEQMQYLSDCKIAKFHVGDDGYVLVEQFSPLGKDCSREYQVTDFDDLTAQAKESADAFDPSTEATFWLDEDGHGKRGAPWNMGVLYDECEEELNLLEAVADYLYRFESNES
jgi:hypothetical protein